MSYTIDIFTHEGKKKDAVTLDGLFGDEQINESLMHEYVVMYLANQRQSTAKVKTRSEVALSGRKLFRQKGTGRARVGDAASPIRRKGGVAFGPSPEVNREKKMNQRMKQKALLSSLVVQLKQGVVQGVIAITPKTPKTKDATATLEALHIDEKKTLFVTDQYDETVYKSFRNIPTVSVTTLSLMNPYDVLTHKHILFTQKALQNLSTRFHLLTQSS